MVQRRSSPWGPRQYDAERNIESSHPEILAILGHFWRHCMLKTVMGGQQKGGNVFFPDLVDSTRGYVIA